MSVSVDEQPFWLGDWKVEPTLNRISRGEEMVKIDPRNMRVLQLLASKPGKVFSQAEIEQAVWDGVVVTTNSVYQSITQLRKALGDERAAPTYIETIPRKGYRLISRISHGSPAQTPKTLIRVRSLRAPRGIHMSILVLGIGAVGFATHHVANVRDMHVPVQAPQQTQSFAPLTLRELPKASNLEPSLLRKLATIALAQGKAQEARAHLVRALELQKGVVGDRHPSTSAILQELAMAYIWESNYSSARESAEAALAALEGYPDSHPDRIAAVLRLGYVLLESGDYARSELHLMRALELSTSVFGEKSITTSNVLITTAILRYSQSRYQEAEHLARQGIAITENAKTDADTAAYNSSVLILALLGQGRYSEARDLCMSVLGFLESGLQSDHPQVIAIRDLLGQSLLGLQEFDAAAILFRENIKLWQENDGWSLRAAASASALGEALLGQGRTSEAAEYLSRASLELAAHRVGRDAEMRFREHQSRLERLRLAQAASDVPAAPLSSATL